MNLTTKSKYGLRAVYYLKQKYDQGPIPISQLVSELHLSQNYLEQLFIKLKNYDIVNSFRGKNGGYKLAKDPDQISIGSIIRALEGDISLATDCDDCSENDYCGKIDCATKVVFLRIDKAVSDVIDNTYLSDI